MRFQWNPMKARANLIRRGVSFEEAATVFGDPLSKTIADPLHSENEERFVLVGMSARSNVLVVVHTDRGDSVRIISVRPATRTERRNYEEGFQTR